jgi:outer membrane protein assembly factor BamB
MGINVKRIAAMIWSLGMATLAMAAGPREIYRGKNLWFDNGRLIGQSASRVRIIDPRSKKTLFDVDLGVESSARNLIRVFGDQVVYTTREKDQFLVTGYSLRNRKKLWQFDSSPIAGPEPMGLVGDSLFATSRNEVFKVTTGGKRVAERAVPWPHSLTTTIKHVYFCSEHELYRLDLETLTRGWRSYCDPTTFYLSRHGPIIHGNLHWSLRGIGDDGQIVWTTSEPRPGFRDYISADLRFAHPERIAAVGARWRTGDPSGTMLSEYVYLYSSRGQLLWKKPMAAHSAVVFGNHVAVLRNHLKGAEDGPNRSLQIRSVKDGRLLWESKPQRLHSLEAAGPYLLAHRDEGDIVYLFGRR